MPPPQVLFVHGVLPWGGGGQGQAGGSDDDFALEDAAALEQPPVDAAEGGVEEQIPLRRPARRCRGSAAKRAGVPKAKTTRVAAKEPCSRKRSSSLMNRTAKL